MKRRFTILTAALALLTFLAVPMGMWGQTTYEQLTSIANIDEDAQYVLGIDGTGFHYSNTSGWGLTGLPEEHTPYYYRLVVAADGQSFKAYIDTPIYGNTYYMTIPTSNAFTMTTSSDAANTDLIIGTTCTGVSTPNYAVANKTTTARHLRRNGSSGLRSYAGTTGSIAYFYKVVTSSGPVQLDAPTLTATPSNEKVTLTWNSINGASSYTIQYADNTSFTGATTITNATSPKEISGLTNGTTYYFKAMSVGDGSDYLSSDYGTVVSSTPANVVTITITQDAIAGFTNVYNWYDWSVSDISGKLYAYKSGGMQFNSSKTAYWIYNTTAVPGNITSVKMTKASGTDRSWTLKAGNSAMTTTSDGTQIGNAQTVGTSGATWNVSGDYNYFLLYVSGGSTVISSIEITYTPTSASDPSISADDVEIAYDAEEGIINYTINNPVEGGSITASCDAEWIEVDDTPQTGVEGSIDFSCAPNSNFYAHSATVTLTYTYGDSKATVTKEVTVTQAKNPNANGSTAEYPITVSEALEAIDEVETVSDIYVGGIVSNIVTEYSSQHDNITFDMIDEEGDEYFVRAYRCGGNEAANVMVGDEVVVYGTLFKYNNSIYEFQQGCELVSLTHPVSPAIPSITVADATVSVDAEEHDGTLDLTYENLTITEMGDFDIQYYDAVGTETSEPDWIEVLVAEQDPEIGEGYVVSYYMFENEGIEARTAYFKVFALGDEDYVYSNLVTISQAAPVAPATGDEYALYTGELVEGDYLIVYDGGAMNTTVESDRLQYEGVTVNNDVIVTDNAAIVWHIAPSGQYWTIYNADAEAYAASTGAKNKAQMLADGTDDKALWTVSGTETYEFVNKKNTDNNVNANLRKNGTYGFACYATSTGGALSLYKKVAPTETHTLTVDAYTNDNTKDGYNLIASPVNVNPATVAGMTTGDFDLYSFDESQADEWRNYEATAFNLVPGKGYLYAKKATTENQTYSFELTGIPYNNEPIILSKSESGDFPGWNLVGNPFGVTAVLSDNRDFYVMNSDGSDFIQGSGAIAPMQGIFVIAEEDDEELQITVAGGTAIGPTEDSKLVLNLTKGRGIIDRAVVRFGEGRTLPKFMLNADNTKLYITEGNQDYAVVRSNNAGEMPVSFKAAENGNYTLSIEAENVEASYLHLIDNMTGIDVDLLATPSYSFEARTTDYANRFRLEFNTNGVEENNATANFAYFNGSSWTVNNMGEATLQVVDVMGHVISTETISGNTEVNLNQAAGVYMLRLVNGNDVKVQKVVVR